MAVPPTRDELAKACRTAQVIGGALIVSLGVYAFVVNQIQRTHAPFGGFAPGVPHDLLRWILAAVALATLGLVRVLQRTLLANAALPLVRRLQSAGVVGLALCESVAIYGFVLFMVAGRASDFYVFTALALIGFVLYFPRLQTWEERARAMARDAAGRGITPPGT
jgi:F0F1-type ATP synthase membrane subunit c/vacuolar-type H+-ATPase subunit K